jgi:hypothetical protein
MRRRAPPARRGCPETLASEMGWGIGGTSRPEVCCSSWASPSGAARLRRAACVYSQARGEAESRNCSCTDALCIPVRIASPNPRDGRVAEIRESSRRRAIQCILGHGSFVLCMYGRSKKEVCRRYRKQEPDIVPRHRQITTTRSRRIHHSTPASPLAISQTQSKKSLKSRTSFRSIRHQAIISSRRVVWWIQFEAECGVVECIRSDFSCFSVGRFKSVPCHSRISSPVAVIVVVVVVVVVWSTNRRDQSGHSIIVIVGGNHDRGWS